MATNLHEAVRTEIKTGVNTKEQEPFRRQALIMYSTGQTLSDKNTIDTRIKKYLSCLPETIQLSVLAILVSVSYYLGAKLGLKLSFKPDYIAALWFPNAILLATLFLSRPKHWVFFLLAVVPAELAADLPSGIPLNMAIGFVLSDWVEVVTAALLLRKFYTLPPAFSTLGQTTGYMLCCVLIAPSVSALPGALVTGMDQLSVDYWTRWARWFLGDATTHLLITPVIVLWLRFELKAIRSGTARRIPELLFTSVLLILSSLILMSGMVIETSHFPAIIYLPLPVLLWASVRFGSRWVFLLSAFFAIVCIWFSSKGLGPLITFSIPETVRNLQIFLLITLAPILCLAALMEDHQRTKTKLQSSEGFLKTIVENIPNMIFIKDAKDLRFISFNKAGEELLGYSREELIGKNDYDFFPKEDADRFTEADRNVLESGHPQIIEEEQIQTGNQGRRTLYTQKIPLCDNRGAPRFLLGISEDISERIKTGKQIEKSLKEKEVLLSEIHHRVKNNLAVIISLLNLQATRIKDEQVLQVLADSRERVRSIALIHETLYMTDDFARLNLEDYAKKLGNQLIQVMVTQNVQVSLLLDIKDVYLDLDHAIPCGIIISELLTNAFKYAFPDKKGQVRIKARKTPSNEIELIIHDNGIGLPDGVDFSDPSHLESLGLNIVYILTRDQLDGRIDIQSNNGAYFCIRWPYTVDRKREVV